jgi:hypothetical protein
MKKDCKKCEYIKRLEELTKYAQELKAEIQYYKTLRFSRD